MAADKRRYTVEECLSFLDDDFDIPEDGFDSEFEGLDDDDDDPCAEIIDITTHDLTNDEPPLRLSDFEITSKKVQDETALSISITFQNPHGPCFNDTL